MLEWLHPVIYANQKVRSVYMEDRAFVVSSPKNLAIAIKVIPGHFATSNSHTSHYLDVSGLKSNASTAKDAARELAVPFLASAIIDTIVCMEETEVVGAFVAQELLQEGTAVMNSGREIHIVTPILTVERKLVFQSSTQKRIFNKNILLLVSSVAGGKTVQSALECINYYGGILTGISSVFSSLNEIAGHKIHSVFSTGDIPGYRSYRPNECSMCAEGRRLDAIVNNTGYTTL